MAMAHTINLFKANLGPNSISHKFTHTLLTGYKLHMLVLHYIYWYNSLNTKRSLLAFNKDCSVTLLPTRQQTLFSYYRVRDIAINNFYVALPL